MTKAAHERKDAMAEVKRVPINKENWRAVTKLKVAEGDERWVAPNWYSIIQAMMEGYESQAILAGEEIVGYLMYEVNTAKRAVFVDRLMVSVEHRGNGYGGAALVQVLDEARAHSEIDRSVISFVPGNDGAKRLYERLGYIDTGKIHDGEHVYEIDLRAAAQG